MADWGSWRSYVEAVRDAVEDERERGRTHDTCPHDGLTLVEGANGRRVCPMGDYGDAGVIASAAPPC